MLTDLVDRAADVHSPGVDALQLPPWIDLLRREAHLPTPVGTRALAELDEVVIAQRRLPAGGTAFFQGQAFTHLRAVRTGSFKVSVVVREGREHVCQFCFAGDLMGLDGLGSGVHASTATALEDSIVAWVHLERARDAGAHGRWHEMLCGQMGRALVREHGRMLLLASAGGWARVATFLLELSEHARTRGASPVDLHLCMCREDIGSYLGLRLETVSRILSELQQQGVIDVNKRHIVIRSLGHLRDLVERNSA
jgi:CRP/FNR family transcriptional regulator, anaerobic regulatory protein